VRQPNAIGKICGLVGEKPFDAGGQFHDISLCFDQVTFGDLINKRHRIASVSRIRATGIPPANASHFRTFKPMR
jgi:hypothetical protein